VYLIKDAKALYNGKDYNYGIPYLAAFDKTSGSYKYMASVNRKKYPLLDYIVDHDSVNLIFNDQTIIYSLVTGKYPRIIQYDTLNTGALSYPPDRHKTYLNTDSLYQSLHEYDPHACYMMSSKNKLLILNRHLDFEKTLSLNDLWIWRGSYKKYDFLYQKNQMIIVDKNHKKIGELSLGKNIMVIDNKLFSVGKNSIVKVDLDKEFE
jgi:hypothetical protein